MLCRTAQEFTRKSLTTSTGLKKGCPKVRSCEILFTIDQVFLVVFLGEGGKCQISINGLCLHMTMKVISRIKDIKSNSC